MKKIVLSFWLFIFSGAALSYDGQATGKLDLVEVADAHYSFRVRLEGEPALCGNANKWAYINNSDPNYSAYVSSLLAAKMAQKVVTVYASRDTHSNAYCKIVHFQFR
ncbi:MAG: hypothetical protein K6L81_18060 [Agarilytica sp.]